MMQIAYQLSEHDLVLESQNGRIGSGRCRNIDELVANDDAIRAEAISYTESYWRKGYTGVAEAHPDLVDDAGRLQVTTRRTRKDGSLVDVALQGLPVIVGGN